MHWLDELLDLAFSHSAIVPKTQRVPAVVCRQNGALPVCAATWGAACSTAIAMAALSAFIGWPF
jgi:hypothetical protein